MSQQPQYPECEACRVSIHEAHTKIESRLTAVEITLWGQTGNNGLRADIRELKSKIDVLLRFFWVATAMPPLIVAVVVVLKFLGQL